MWNEKLSIIELIQTKNLYDQCNQNLAEAGRRMGLSREAVRLRLLRYSKSFDDYIPKYDRIDLYIQETENIINKILEKGCDNLEEVMEKEGINLSRQTFAKHLNIHNELLSEARLIKKKGQVKRDYTRLRKKVGEGADISTATLINKDRNLYGRVYYYWNTYQSFLDDVNSIDE